MGSIRMADEVSHVDIYRALGILEGKLDTMSQTLLQKHTDISSAFDRISSLERSMAKWAGIALACSIVIPLLVTAAAPRLHFPQPAAVEARPGGQ
jgi:hypothetical protein